MSYKNKNFKIVNFEEEENSFEPIKIKFNKREYTLNPLYRGIEDKLNPNFIFAPRNSHIVWAPFIGAQTAFLECPIYEVMFGGAKGGGKSDILLADFLPEQGIYGSDWVGVLFRKSYPDLEEIVARSRKLYPKIIPGSSFNKNENTWYFPSGAILKFRYLKNPKDVENYQGHQYTWMAFDQIEQWTTSDEYEQLKLSVRSPIKGIPKRVRSTANPGGIGHSWVKEYFVDNGPYSVVKNELGLKRVYIPSTIDDNPAILYNDPEYKIRLESIPNVELRKALRYGIWDIAIGAALSGIFHRHKHIIKPFIPPKNWYCWRSFDWGSARPSSVNFFCESNGERLPDGRIFPAGTTLMFNEIYTIKKHPVKKTPMANKGTRESAQSIAQRIKRYENFLINTSGVEVHPGPADTQIFNKTSILEREGAQCIYDGFEEEGIEWLPANKAPGSRVMGFALFCEMLGTEENDIPTFYVTSNCKHWLRTVLVLPTDPKDYEDIKKDATLEDHAWDSTRYAILFARGYFEDLEDGNWK